MRCSVGDAAVAVEVLGTLGFVGLFLTAVPLAGQGFWGVACLRAVRRCVIPVCRCCVACLACCCAVVHILRHVASRPVG